MGEQHANGSRMSRHWLVADATVGVIANPMSGRPGHSWMARLAGQALWDPGRSDS